MRNLLWSSPCRGVVMMVCDGLNLPNALMPDIAGRLLFEELADFTDLCLARGSVEEQIAQLARVGLYVNGALGGPWVALEDEDLVLGPTFLLDCVHCAGASGVLNSKVESSSSSSTAWSGNEAPESAPSECACVSVVEVAVGDKVRVG